MPAQQPAQQPAPAAQPSQTSQVQPAPAQHQPAQCNQPDHPINYTQPIPRPVSAKKGSFSAWREPEFFQPFPRLSMLTSGLRACDRARKESFFRRSDTPQCTTSIKIVMWGEGGQCPREPCQKEHLFADTGLQNMGTAPPQAYENAHAQKHHNSTSACFCLCEFEANTKTSRKSG